MDIFETIRIRRSVRDYKSDPIPEEKLRKVLDVMRQAPSAVNRQPWKFIIVKDAKIRQEMVETCGAQPFLSQAPVVVVACGIEKIAWHGVGGNRSASAVDIDVSIALTYLTLAATSEGLGTCWISAFNEACFKRLLKVPEEAKIVSVTPLGYPASPDLLHPIKENARKSFNEVFCDNVYSYKDETI